MAQTFFLVGKKFLTKNLPIYTTFLFKTTNLFSKNLVGRYKTFRVKFEEDHIGEIINIKRRFRKFKIQFKARSKENVKIKKLRDLEVMEFLFKRSIKFKSGLNNLNLIKERLNLGLSLNSLKSLNTILPKLNKINLSIKKVYSLLSEFVKTGYQLIDKTIHSPNFNKLLILVFFLFGAFIVEDQLDRIKITQKVPGDEKAVNINATADTDLVFEYDYELSTKTKILKYIIHPAFASDENQPQLVLTDYDGKKLNPQFVVDREGEKSFSVRIARNKIPPGAYEALLEVYKDGVYYQQEKDFTYGVLSVNTNKATFIPGEEITLNMGALKHDGHTICDADLELKITSPSGKESNPEVKQSGFCERDNVTNVPDYLASHKAEGVGKHKMTLVNKDNGYQIEDFYEVRAEVPYSIERKGPSRIYPFVAYPMEITVIANQDFIGKITERVPKGFLIKGFETTSEETWQTITWDVDLKKGENTTYSYFFDAPDISPFLYLTGPLSIGDYQEVRMWQIASDADGSGTNVVVPTGVLMGSTDQTFTFTYDPSEVLNSGELAIKVPTSRGWSTPQGSAGTAGYTTVSGSGNTTIGNVLVSGDSTSQGVWTLTEDDSDMCNTTASPFVDTTTKKEGAGAIQCNNSSSALPDDTDTFSFDASAQNWSSYTQISFWLRSTKALTSAAGIDFGYDNNAIFGSPVAIFDTGTVSANTWTYFVFDMTGTRTAITAFGLICDTTGCDSNTFWLDEVMVGPGSPTFVANGPDVDIRARFLDLASTDTVTVTYGAGGGTSGADVPSTSGIDEFTTRTRFDAGGTLTNISSHPTVNVASPAIDISGTCKQDDQTTNCTDTGTIKVAINGSIQAQVQNTVAGTWTISGLTSPNNGDVITVFIDGAGEADEAVAVTTYDGSGNVAGVELIEQRLSIGNSDNRTITNANLSQYDNSVSADEDIFYDVDASNDLTLNDTSKSSAEIYIKSGNTYRPDSTSSGNITTKALRIVGILIADGNTINLTGGGSPLVITGGTLNEDTSTFKYTSNSNVSVAELTYHNLEIKPSAVGNPTYIMDSSGNQLIMNDISIGDGTNPVSIDWISSGGFSTIRGNITLNNNSTWIKNNQETILGGTNSIVITDNNSTKQDLGILEANKTVQLGSSITLTRINIGETGALNLQSSGYNLKITGSGTGSSRPFIISGNLNEGTNSTIEYAGGSATEIQAETYNNLTLNQTGTTFTSSGNLTITDIFTINAGTFNAGGNLILLQGTSTPFIINGTFTPSTSTVKYNVYDDISIPALNYYNLEVGTSLGLTNVTYTLNSGTLNVSNNLTIGSTAPSTLVFDINTNDAEVTVEGDILVNTYGTYSASSNQAAPLSVAGDFTNNGTFTHNDGKVILDSAVDTSQSLNGAVSFHTLEIATGDREVKLGTAGTKSIVANGSLTLTGTDCSNMMRFRTSANGVQATLAVDVSASASVSHVDLQDINLTTKSVTAGNSVNSGNNSANWTISPNGCIGTSTNQDTTGSSFQRKVIYDDQNSRYWSFNHDGDEIEVKYSSDEGSTWTNPATTASGRLPYDTNDFSVWWRSISTVEYIVVAVADGGSIKLRQGTLSGTDVTWDTDVSIAMDETGTYSRPYISFDSANHIWVGATYNDGSDYVYKTVVSAEAASTDPSTWTWTTTPYQLSNAQTSLNVYGTLTALSSEDMYATFVVDTGLLGCRWDDSDTMWEDGTGASCLPTIGGGGESEYFDSLEEGLVGYWKMNEVSWNGTSGEVVDQTLNNYDGTRIGDATTISSGFGKSGTFDGTGDYVSMGNVLNFGDSTDFTLSAWVNRTTFTGDDQIIAKRNSESTAEVGYLLWVDGNDGSGDLDDVRFMVSDGSDEFLIETTTTMTTSGWNLVTVVFDDDSATNSTIYINGVDSKSSTTGTIADVNSLINSVNFTIGAESDAGEPWNGYIDEVRVYDRAITGEEVAKLYQLQPDSVNIDDASDFGALRNTGRQLVRTKSGVLYSFVNDSGRCEMWKSTDGIVWVGWDSETCKQDRPVSIAIDSNDTIHATYIVDDSFSDQLWYVTYLTGVDLFNTPEQVGSSDTLLNISYLDITIDSSNKPHIAFLVEFLSSEVYYNNRVSTAWLTNSVMIETISGAGHSSSITINDEDIPEISFINGLDNDLTIALGSDNNPDSAGQWTLQDVDTDVNDTMNQRGTSSLVNTITGDTWTAYVDINNYIALAKHADADSWSTWTTITSNTNAGYEPSLVIAGNGDVYVFYENDQDDIAYDVYDGTDWAGETVLHEGTFQNVKVKSAFEWNNYGPNTIDYIYSDGTDVYYDSLYLRRSPTNVDDVSDFGTMPGAGRQIIRSSSGVLYNFLNDGGNCEMWKSIDGTNWTLTDNEQCDSGGPIAAAIDSDDNIQVIYPDNAVQNLIESTTYSIDTDTFGTTIQLSGNNNLLLQELALTIDQNGEVHIAWVEQGTFSGAYSVKYKNKTNNIWQTSVQIASGTPQPTGDVDITINDSNIPEIVFLRANGTLNAVVGNQTNATSFTNYQVDSSVNITDGQRIPSIAVSPETGDTWIAYVESSTNYVTLAKHEGATWTSNWSNITSKTDVGYEPSIAIYGSDIYVIYKDDQDDVVYDIYNGTSWNGETVLESHGVLQDVKTKWSYVNNYDSTGVAPVQTNTYYIDNSDNCTAGSSCQDPDSVWTDDANAFDGDNSTYAYATALGSSTTNYLRADGTNAPSTTSTIVSVKARAYGYSVSPSDTYIRVNTSSGYNDLYLSVNSPSWTSYTTLTTPSGGWTWNEVQSISTRIWNEANVENHYIGKIEILVESTNPDAQNEIDYLYSDGTDVFYNRLLLGAASVPGVQDSIVTGLPTGLHKNISTVGQTISTIDYVHLAYVNSSGNIYYDRYDGDWDFTNASLDANTDNTYLGLSKDTATNDVYLGYIGSTSDDIFTKKSTYSAGPSWSWGTSTTLVTDATEIFTNYNANNTGNGKVGAIYSIGDLSPYNIGWETVLSGTTNNAPTISNVVVNGASNISLTAGSTHNVSWTATITDLDGNAEIAGVTGKLYRSGVAGAEACTPDNNNCYADAVCDLTGCSGNTCTATCTAAMYFHADATDANSTMPSEYWRGWMEATDSHSDTGSEFSATNAPDVESLSALDIVTSIDYGLMLAGDSSSEKTTLVTNEGNIILDLELLGDSMCTDYPTCAGDSIAVGQQEYSMSTFTYGSGTDLTSSAFRIQFNLAKPTASPSTQTKNLYWRLGLDLGQNLGEYDGVNTVLAKNDNIP
ncbi:MAG TPA: LamG domain-containing protein [Candidatus Dojkabacteria bacterium]|nr:LamG domain-containing protein [Candidatus Dojkabacteria bacterium]